MTDREYEVLVQSLVEELRRGVPSFSGAEIKGGSRNRITGASGFPHQIDVSLHVQDTLVLVECKHWLEPVDAEAVLSFASRLADIRALNGAAVVHASLVSTKAATRGAAQLANHFGVSLDVVANEREYGIRLSNQVFVTVAERLTPTDQSNAEVVRGNQG